MSNSKKLLLKIGYVFCLSLIFIGLGSVVFGIRRSRAQSNWGPITGHSTRVVKLVGGSRDGDYTTSVSLTGGEGARVRIAVSIDKDTPVEFYSGFGRDGAFSWAQAPGFDRRGGETVSFSLSSGKSLVYDKKSTFYQECEIVGNDCNDGDKIDDNGFGESPIFDKIARNLKFKNDTRYNFYYDLKVVDEPKPEFNSHPTDQLTFQVRNITSGGSFTKDLSGVNAGDELEFQIYVHNNPRGSVARNTKVGVENWSQGPASSFSIKGFVDADNSDRAKNSVDINLASSLKLNYVNGSAKWNGWPTVLSASFINQTLSDDIITPGGVSIGDQGTFDGCWDFLSKAVFKAKTESEPTPTPTLTPSPTPTPTPTPSPSPTPSLTPTPTPTPSITPTPSPTPTLTPPPVLGATAPPVLPETGTPLGVGLGLASLGSLGIYLYKKFRLL